MNFASDNVMGASPPVLEALVRANAGAQAAYGNDAYTARVEAQLGEVFERPVAAILVTTGTAANALALGVLVPPWGSVLCHEESHINDDECGAPEFFTHGAKLVGLPGVGGKLAPETVLGALARIPPSEKAMQPAALSLTQATEAGLAYRPDEIGRLAEIARSRGLALHMDGARFANALVTLGCSPAEMTWRAGVDILSFGATKNGCLAAEAVILFDEARAAELRVRRKRAGHTLSKGRLVAAQLEGYLAGGHWLDNARHANAMARRLADALKRRPGVRLAWPNEANEVFPILPRKLDARLRAAGFLYHYWESRALTPGERIGADETMVRLVTSFATQAADVDRLIAACDEAMAA